MTPTTTKLPFNDRVLRTLAPPPADSTAKAVEYTDASMPGLKLAVGRQGTRTFSYRYKCRGRSRCLRIGTYPAISLKEARETALKHRAEVERGHDPSEQRLREREAPTFEAFASRQYLPWAETAKRSVKGDKSKLKNHLLPKLGRYRLADIGARDIQMHHAAIKESHCAATANRHLALLSAIFRKAVEWDVIDKNPCEGVRQFKEANGRERFLTADEISRMWAAMADEPNTTAVAALKLLLLTGVRREEALQARWTEVDLANSTWRLVRTKNGRQRHVTLNDAALELLAGLPSRGASPWLFPGRDPQKPLNNPRKAFQRILDAAGIEHTRIHDLRHSFASLAVNAGVSLYTVQEMLGHSSAAMTQRYAHLANATMRSASQKVGDAVSAAIRGEVVP